MSKFVQWLRSVDRGLDRMELFPAYRLRDLRRRLEAERQATAERRAPVWYSGDER